MRDFSGVTMVVDSKKIAIRRRDELTEKLMISRFANVDWAEKDVPEGIIASARRLARLIQESHEGEI